MKRKRHLNEFPTKHAYLISCLVSFFFLLASSAQAENVTLTWHPSNPPADTYRIFQRTSAETYNYSEWVYQGFDTTCVITDLAPNTIYYFIVRAYTDDAESEDSNEVSYSTWIYTPDYQDSDTYAPDSQDHDTGTSTVLNDGENRFQIR